ncbi:hypothetical protein C1646_773535 [Rhizophagus diaphanus]|nr:hypothetical protein C1646_773535 [Rhizophagus diaphanus] [Rhizophagus sp. MUCL 43196]
MSTIITKYVANHKLNKDISNEELSQHALALLELLTDKLKRLKGHQRLQGGYSFSKEQVFLLIPDQRIEWCVSQVTPWCHQYLPHTDRLNPNMYKFVYPCLV